MPTLKIQEGDIEKDIPKDKFKVAFNEGMEVCANSGSILDNVIINLKAWSNASI